MDNISMINAEKAVNSGLTAKNSSTIAATDLVQLFANDGTPNGKISKADLMDAVKASLPSLLSDQTTTADNVLTLASNALGKSTVANLASVLGGLYQFNGSGLDADNITVTGAYMNSNNINNMPSVEGYNRGGWGTLVHIEANYKIQIYCGGTSTGYGYYIRFRTGAAWHPWNRISGTEK